MSEFLNRARLQFILYKLAIWKGVNGCLKVGVMAYLGATASVHWSDMHSDERVVVILTAYVAMASFIDGFLDQTTNQLRGKSSVSNESKTP